MEKEMEPKHGRDDAALDIKPGRRVNAPKIEDAAEERKAGGRIKRKRGGMAEKKDVGSVSGEECRPNAGRKPRKAGGRASNENPFSSARAGSPPPGRKMDMQKL